MFVVLCVNLIDEAGRVGIQPALTYPQFVTHISHFNFEINAHISHFNFEIPIRGYFRCLKTFSLVFMAIRCMNGYNNMTRPFVMSLLMLYLCYIFISW